MKMRITAGALGVLIASIFEACSAPDHSIATPMSEAKVVDLGADRPERRRDFGKASLDSSASLLAIVSNPKKFHGKKVRVKGYIMMEFETQYLFPSRELSIDEKNGLWVDYELKRLSPEITQGKLVPVLVEGIVDSGGRFEPPMICDITRLELSRNWMETK